ncbi:MAG: two-component system, OmpR family, sensor kinase [Thermoleophilaceae bacterium]|nr:two-component system, OmpR family, sensor kinase [Thermoleophilaceae bacterium]
MKRLERLPIRWRLALTSAGLTFAILLLFALIIGVFTARQVRSSFDDDLKLTAVDLAERVHASPVMNTLGLDIQGDSVVGRAVAGDAVVRIVSPNGAALVNFRRVPNLGPPRGGIVDANGYRVVSRELRNGLGETVAYLQYGKPVSHLQHTMARIKLFLIFGVLGGSVLALLAGLALARRAISPIARLTEAAKTIARTRDPSVQIPKPVADDEVADLARTLEEMLIALGQARTETEASLDRQRRFVADASHELRTPLTSILANLELLAAELEGEDAEIAESALRSSRRMRRLVADLLLLARADAGRVAPREPVNAGAVVREAAGEAAAVAHGHGLTVDVQPGAPLVVEAPGDELHRLVLNLIQNALVHTPPGTAVDVHARREGDDVVIEVSDEGPGIPAELRDRIFDRFVRGNGDRSGTNGSGSGLGLSIVRAVAESIGGGVEVGESDSGGARFTVRIPAAGKKREPALPPPPPPEPSAAQR